MRTILQEEQEAHIEKYGHQAIYASHTCTECQMSYFCRRRICKRPPDTLCHGCESAALVTVALTLGPRLKELLQTPVPIHDVFAHIWYNHQWQLYESVKQELRGQVDGLIAQARLTQEMEPR